MDLFWNIGSPNFIEDSSQSFLKGVYKEIELHRT